MKTQGATREGSGRSRKEDMIVNTQVSWGEIKCPVTKVFSAWEGSHKIRWDKLELKFEGKNRKMHKLVYGELNSVCLSHSSGQSDF